MITTDYVWKRNKVNGLVDVGYHQVNQKVKVYIFISETIQYWIEKISPSKSYSDIADKTFKTKFTKSFVYVYIKPTAQYLGSAKKIQLC